MTSPTDYPPPSQPAAAPPAAPPPGAPPGTAQPEWGHGWGHDHHRDERRGSIVGGVILLLLGAAFLADEFVPNLDIWRLWPLILVVIGVLLIAGAVRRSA